MNFILLGFSQHDTIRRFTFDGVADDRTRSRYTVTADLLLARQFNIKLQDLPLLCLRLLQVDTARASVSFSESDMRAYALEKSEEAKREAEKAAARSRRSSHALSGRSAAPTLVAQASFRKT